MSQIVGIDVGGTFTDFVSIDTESGVLRLLKVPSTPDSPDRVVIDAIETSGIDPALIDRLVHGSTVSTNAILERKGARVGLITTAGFEDVLEIGRSDRAHLYDLSWEKPQPLVPRERRLGVVQRTDGRGQELTPLDEAGVRDAVQALRTAGVDAIAVCFLHSYANPDHELRARDIALELDPTMHVSLSSEVMNAMREFERTSTVVVDAYVKPVIAAYLRRLEHSIEHAGLTTRLQVMQSSGGVMTSDDSADLPIHTLLSGPAGGVIAARHLAARSGYPNVITLDIGGTSADVALIIDGEPELTTETEVDWGIPVQVPMIDIRTIGAGGGSIARLDRGGRLKVGPESAGARPGPACFGHGSDDATVTDANLVLGYLNADNYAGGTFPLDTALAVKAIEQNVGGPLGFELDAAARGVLDIINANMRNLIRQITVQQGHDPRDFALMAFGGGGPVHAVAVARELGIKTVLIPPTPGVLSAFGLLLAVPRHDFVQSLPRRLDELEWIELETTIEHLAGRGRELLAGAGVESTISTTVSLDMQFERQNYTLNVVLRDGIGDVDSLRAAFDESYEQKFGYRMDEQPVVIVNCRVSVAAEPDSTAGRAALSVEEVDQTRHEREVFFEEWGHRAMCPVIQRSGLRPGDELITPCIVEQPDTSVVIPPGVMAAVDDDGMIVVRLLDLPSRPEGAH